MFTVVGVYIAVVLIGYYLFGRKKNPYINAHKKRADNELNYMQYLNWLDKNGGDVPIKKVEGKEVEEVAKKISDSINL